MTPAALVETLRARGVHLRAVGDRLRVRPAEAVTPDEIEALRQYKAEVLALLPRPPALRLDPITVRGVLRDHPDPHHVAMLTFDVTAAVAQLEAEIRTGTLGPAPLLVRDLPLGDWLPLDTLARLLRTSRTP